MCWLRRSLGQRSYSVITISLMISTATIFIIWQTGAPVTLDGVSSADFWRFQDTSHNNTHIATASLREEYLTKDAAPQKTLDVFTSVSNAYYTDGSTAFNSTPITDNLPTTTPDMTSSTTVKADLTGVVVSTTHSQETVGTEVGQLQAVCSPDARQVAMEHVCRSIGGREMEAQTRGYGDGLLLFINPEKKVLFCILQKVGSQSLNVFFSRINRSDRKTWTETSNKPEKPLPRVSFSSLSEKTIHKLRGFHRIDNIPLKAALTLFANYTKLIQVRHPLQRFVSAYYERIYKHTKDPDFSRFVEEVLAGRSNRHWDPFYVVSSPCVLHYDIIMKAETSEHDVTLLKEQFGWTAQLPHGHVNKDYTTTETEQTSSYKYDGFLKDFATEHPDLFERLLGFFKPDLELFGYSWSASTNSSCSATESDCC